MTQARDLGDAANKANFLDNVSSDLQAQLTALILPAGLIMPFGASSAPTGYLACEGQEVLQSAYPALYAAIGLTWGAASSPASHFKLPDLRGAFLRGTGSHGTSNMADGNDYAGPSVGSFASDKVQRHTGHFEAASPGHMGRVSCFEGLGLAVSGTQPAVTGGLQGQSQRFQNTSGAASNGFSRIVVDIGDGPETRPFNAGILYCIKT